jgi:hypothetical protein
MNIFKRYIKKLEIHSLCKKYDITNYKINKDLSINVDHSVDLTQMGLIELPLKFNEVWGHFDCSNNNLTTLEGSPKFVNGHFYCINNKITSLKGSPVKINGYFDCSNNLLTDLKHGPSKIINYYKCNRNQLKNFDGFNTNGVKNFSYFKNHIYYDLMIYCNIENLIFKEFNKELPNFIKYINKFKVIKNGEINWMRMRYLFSLFSPNLYLSKYIRYIEKNKNDDDYLELCEFLDSYLNE